jgi:hypothetical protein
VHTRVSGTDRINDSKPNFAIFELQLTSKAIKEKNTTHSTVSFTLINSKDPFSLLRSEPIREDDWRRITQNISNFDMGFLLLEERGSVVSFLNTILADSQSSSR